MTGAPILTIEESETKAGPVTIRVAGELDLVSADLLRAHVDPHLEQGGAVVLDVAGLTFCDSAGLGALVGFVRQARRTGGSVVLEAPDARLRELLEITGLDRVLLEPDAQSGVA